MANEVGDNLYNILHSDEANKEEEIKNIIVSTDSDTRVSAHHYYDSVYDTKLDEDIIEEIAARVRSIKLQSQ